MLKQIAPTQEAIHTIMFPNASAVSVNLGVTKLRSTSSTQTAPLLGKKNPI